MKLVIPADELEFVETYQLPMMTEAAQTVPIILVLKHLIAAVGAAVLVGARVEWFVLLQLFLWATLLLAANVSRALPRWSLSLRSLNAACVAVFVANGLLGALPRTSGFFDAESVRLLAQMFDPLVWGLFVPCHPAMTLLGSAAIVGGNAWLASGRTAELLVLSGLLCAITAQRWTHHVFHRRVFNWGRFNRSEFMRVLASSHVSEQMAIAIQQRESANAIQLALDAAAVARSRLIRMFMHDMRSPLLVASNIASEWTEKAAEGNLSECATSTTDLQDAVARMERILASLVEFELAESNQLKLSESEFTLRQLCDAVCEECRLPAESKGVHLRFETPAGSAGDVLLLGDLGLLVRAVEAGISNAVHFSRASQTVTVSFAPGELLDNSLLSASMNGTRQGWEAVRVTVADSGAGIEPEELQALQVGSVFAQVGRAQLNGSSHSGLGLARARQILKLHHESTLRLHSDGPGRGATFELTLNLQRRSDVARGSTRELTLSSSTQQSPRGVQQLWNRGVSRVIGVSHFLSVPARVSGSARVAASRDEPAEHDASRDSRTTAEHMVISARELVESLAQSACVAGGGGGHVGSVPEEASASRRSHGHLPRAQAAGAGTLQLGQRRSTTQPSPGTAHRHVSAPQGQSFATTVEPPASIARRAESASALSAACGPGPVPGRTAAAAPPQQLAPPGTGTPKPDKPVFPPDFRVLYAEDDAVLRKSVMLRVFKPLGVVVDEAPDGQEAMRVFCERRANAPLTPPYSFVVLDNQMPFKTGTQVASEMRAFAFINQIVGMTGDPNGCEDRNTFEASGIDLCLDKNSSSIKWLKELVRAHAL